MDEQLIQAARTGCEQAQARLYGELFPDVVRHVASRGASWEDAEDAAQEAIVIAFDRLGDVQCSRAIAAYTKTIARRLVHKRLVAERRRADALARQTIEDQPSAETLVMAAQDTAMLVEAFHELPERDQALLRSRVLLEHSTAQVAGEFAVTAGSARVLLTRARSRLRANWEGMGVLVGALLLRWRAGSHWRTHAQGVTQAALAAMAVVVTIVHPPVEAAGSHAGGQPREVDGQAVLSEAWGSPEPEIVEGRRKPAGAFEEAVPVPLGDRQEAGSQTEDSQGAPVVVTPLASVWEQEPPSDPDVDIQGPDGIAVRVYLDEHVPDHARMVWDHDVTRGLRDALPSLVPHG